MQKNPSRLLIKLVKGNPSEKIKTMFGVYKITPRLKYFDQTTQPLFVHSTQEDQLLFFSTAESGWIFQKKFETIMTWTKEKTVFSEEFWSKQNGSAVLNFGSSKFTINMISY